MNKIYKNASWDATKISYGFKYLFFISCMLMAGSVWGQTTYYSKAAATDFNDVNSWGTATNGTGTSPASISSADNYVIQNGSNMTLTGNASVRTLLITGANSTLTITSNTLTVAIPSQFNSNFTVSASGTFTISGGSLVVNGNFNLSSGKINQTGGDIIVDGNNGGLTTNSVASGTNIVNFTPALNSDIVMTGGSFTIVDPHTSTTETFSCSIPSVGHSEASGTHTFKFGDGVSNDNGGTSGFRYYSWVGNGVFRFRNVEINTGTIGTNRFVHNGTSSSFYNFIVTGNLNIISGEYRNANTSTTSGATYIAGNLTNNGTFTNLGAVFFANATASSSSALATSPTTNAQTISGTGVFRNLTASPTANYTSVTFNNTSVGGVTFASANSLSGVGTGTVSGTLTFLNGVVHTSGNTFTLGVAIGTLGTLTYTAGGFGSGSAFARWYASTGTGTALSGGAIPSFAAGSFPFVSGNPVTGMLARHFHRNTSTFSTGGPFRVTYNDNGNGTTNITTPFTETVSYDRQTNASWTTSVVSPGVLSGTTAQFCIQGEGAFANTSGNVVVVRNGAQFGTAQAGSSHPMGQRAGLTVANQTGTYTLAFASSQAPKQSVATGKWEDGSTWSGGTVPTCSDVTFIMPGHTISVDATTGTANADNIVVSKASTLNISGGTLNVGCTAGFNNDSISNNGTLVISGGTVNINGSLDINNGSNFTHSGGNINIDGNDGSTTANSVRNDKPIFGIGTYTAFATGTLAFTGGTITIVDPHRSATAPSGTTNRSYAFYSNLSASTNSVDASTAHTIQFGDGVSTHAGGVASGGFGINTYPGSGRFNFGNLIVNDISNPTTSNRIVRAISWAPNCRGNFTITKGRYDMGSNTHVFGGNVVINDTLIANGGITFANPTGTTSIVDSVPQTVSGTGRIFNNSTPASATANFSAITINNRQGFGGVTFANNFNQVGAQPANAISATALTFTLGSATTASGVVFTNGVPGTTAGSLTRTAGGWTNGSTYGFAWTAANTGSAFTAGSVVSTATSQFPFVTSTGLERSAWINRVTPSAGGVTAITYNEVSGTTSGLNLTDASGYIITQRGNDNWVVSTLGSTPSSATFGLAISATNIFGASMSADSTRIIQASSAIGTHQRGTVLPHGQRIGLTLAQLTSGAFYLGANDNEIPNVTLQSGDWNTASTWSKGVPTCTDNAIIQSGHTVTVSSAANAKNVEIQQGGVLTHNSGGALNIGCSLNNNIFNIAGGTFNMNAGTMNVRGRFILNSNANAIFNQSGGDIIIDGNSGSTATSVTSHIVDLIAYTNTNINLTGGSMTIVNPVASTVTGNCAFKVYPNSGSVVASSGPNWTLKFGNGTSTIAGGNSDGFLMNLTGLSSAIFSIGGNVELNSPTTLANRYLTTSGTIPIRNLTITKGDWRASTTTYISGDLLNNDTFTATSTIHMGGYIGTAAAVSTNSQTIGGLGTFRNSATTSTANITSLTINNSNATGVTLNVPLSVSGTLTMTSGIINTTATNILRLGTTSSGTLTISNASSYVNGPMERFFAAGNAPTAISNNRIPVGINGRLLPVIVNPQTTNATAGIYMRAQVFDNGSPVTPGSGVSNTSNLSWQVNVSPNSIASNFEGAFIAVGDSMTRTAAKLLTSSSQGGTYDGTVGGSAYITAITPNNFIAQNTLIPSSGWSEYFSYGDLSVCPAPTTNATNISIPRVSTNTALLQFDSDPNVTGYLVLVDTAGQSLTSNPLNGTTYASGSQFGARVIGSYNTSAAAYQVAIASLSTTISPFATTPGPGYTVYIFAYNNSGCSGPTYNITPETIALNNCATAPATTGLTTAPMGYANQTSSGFDIVTGTSTATYTGAANLWLDIYTNSAKTIKHPNYNNANTGVTLSNGSPATISVSGLNPSSNYWAELFVEENGCFSAALTTNLSAIATQPSATVLAFSQNFDATPAGMWPAGWYRVGTTNSSSTSITVATSSTAANTAPNGLFIGGTSTTAIGVVAMPAVSTLNSGTYLLKFKVRASTAGQTMTVGYLSNPSDPNSFTVLSNSNATISNIGLTFVDYVISPITVPAGNTTLAFRNEGLISSSLYIDDVVYEQMPFCQVARGGSASFPTTSACGGGSTIGTAIGFNADSLGLTYNWQSSTDSLFSSPTDIGTASSLYSNLNLSNLSTPLYYRHKTTCTNGASTQIGYSNTVLLNVLNPSVTASAGGSVCGNDSAIISATPSTNDSIYWFSTLTGGSDLAVGQSYKTPPLSATTVYYAEATAARPGSSFTLGTITSSASTVSTSGSPLFTSWGGQKTQYIIRASELKASGMMPGNITGFSYPITGVGRTPLVDFKVKMVHTSRNVAVLDSFIASGLTTVYSNPSEPISVGNHSITFTTPFNWDGKTNILVEIFFNHADGGTTASTVTYTTSHSFSSTAFLYDDNRNTVDFENALKLSDLGTGGTSSTTSARPLFTFRGNGKCTASPRTSVTATYVTPPAFSLSKSTDSACNGSATATATTISTGANNYTSYTWSPSTGVSGNSSSGWNFAPTATSRYIVTALDTNSCKVLDTVDVRVDEIPSSISLSQGRTTPTCYSGFDSLMVSGGTLPVTSLNSYTLVSSSSTYTPLSGATSISFIGGTTDDDISAVIPIGFSFNFAGTNYSNVYVSTNGFISFNASAGATSSNNLTSSAASVRPLIAPLWDDLDLASGGASYKLEGSSPNRIFTIEWSSVEWNYLASSAVISFQAKLFEGTNNIEFLYRSDATAYNAGSTSGASVGLAGVSTGSGNFISLNSLGVAPTTSMTTETSTISAKPATGQSYLFRAPIANTIWSPTTGLFTNRATTTAYTGTSLNKVYSKPTASQKYYLTATNGACQRRDSIVDSIKNASNLVVLASANATGAVEQCTDANGWTYYGTAANPDEWLFGIYKNGNNFTATVDITVDNVNKFRKNASSNGANQEHASYIMSRSWNVNATGTVGSGVKVRFFIDPQDITDLLDERDDDYDVLKNTTNPSTFAVKSGFEWFKTVSSTYSPTNWNGNTHSGTIVKLTEDAVSTLNGQTYVELSGITSFSGGSGGAAFGPTSNGLFNNGGVVGLPVTWHKVDVNTLENGNEVVWSTSSEQNTSHFEVEYSEDAVQFYKVSENIPAAGNSSTTQHYKFLHESEMKPWLYYRVKQVDLDGKVDYSKIIIAKRATKLPDFKVLIYPIPLIEGDLNLDIHSIAQTELQIRIIDLLGKEVHREKVPSKGYRTQHKLQLNHLPKGQYQIQIDNSIFSHQQRLVLMK